MKLTVFALVAMVSLFACQPVMANVGWVEPDVSVEPETPIDPPTDPEVPECPDCENPPVEPPDPETPVDPPIEPEEPTEPEVPVDPPVVPEVPTDPETPTEPTPEPEEPANPVKPKDFTPQVGDNDNQSRILPCCTQDGVVVAKPTLFGIGKKYNEKYCASLDIAVVPDCTVKIKP